MLKQCNNGLGVTKNQKIVYQNLKKKINHQKQSDKNLVTTTIKYNNTLINNTATKIEQ